MYVDRCSQRAGHHTHCNSTSAHAQRPNAQVPSHTTHGDVCGQRYGRPHAVGYQNAIAIQGPAWCTTCSIGMEGGASTVLDGTVVFRRVNLKPTEQRAPQYVHDITVYCPYLAPVEPTVKTRCTGIPTATRVPAVPFKAAVAPPTKATAPSWSVPPPLIHHQRTQDEGTRVWPTCGGCNRAPTRARPSSLVFVIDARRRHLALTNSDGIGARQSHQAQVYSTRRSPPQHPNHTAHLNTMAS